MEQVKSMGYSLSIYECETQSGIGSQFLLLSLKKGRKYGIRKGIQWQTPNKAFYFRVPSGINPAHVCCVFLLHRPAMPIHVLQFSPDGQYFASVGKVNHNGFFEAAVPVKNISAICGTVCGLVKRTFGNNMRYYFYS